MAESRAISLYDPSGWKWVIDDAKRFGTIEHIFGKANSMQVTHTDKLVEYASRRLDDEIKFNPEKDYFILTGDNTLVAIVLALLLSVHEEVNVLIFSKNNNCYRARKISIKNQYELEDEPATKD